MLTFSFFKLILLDPSVGIGSCGWQNYEEEFVAALVSYNFFLIHFYFWNF